MWKEFTTAILILSLFAQFTGCYTLEAVDKKVVLDNYTNNKGKGVYVLTENYYEYHFERNKYEIEHDTLYGNGTVTKRNIEKPFEGKIPLSAVIEYKVHEADFSDVIPGIGLAFGILAIISVAAVVGLLVTSN
jgi:hypothetical protein